jgi:integrase
MARRLPPGIELRTAADGTRSYRIRWRQDGHNLSHSFTRLGEATDAKARITAAGHVCHCPLHAPGGTSTKHYGAPVTPAASEPGAVSFGAFAKRHAKALTGVGPGYRKRFAREMELHFAPFADTPLDDIERLDVRDWIVGMETGAHPWLHKDDCNATVGLPCNLGCDAKRSNTTIARLLRQAGSVMATAQEARLAQTNPFRGHRLGRRDRDEHTEMIVLTHAEWAVLQSCFPEGVDRDLATVLIGTGLRWSEATALAVGAVDPFTKPRLHVARAWQDDGDGGFQLGPPKSQRSRRTVTFSGAVLDALLPHISAKADDEFVFTTERGKPLRHSNWWSRVWQPALDAANAKGMTKRPRIHDLRHSHVSWLIAAGRPVPAISRRLGHESITTTIDRYGHMLPDIDDDTIAALEVAMPVSPPGPAAPGGAG